MRTGERRRCAAVLLALLALAACREEERGRPVWPEKGVYKGQPDTALDRQQVEALRQRVERAEQF